MAIIVGTLGNDTLLGIGGEDNVIYGDAVIGQGGIFDGGDDTLIGGANSNNTLIGDAGTYAGIATGGDDTLIGGIGGTNILIGDAVSEGVANPQEELTVSSALTIPRITCGAISKMRK
jgi:Ca2+-binding RTX toxin-like protein